MCIRDRPKTKSVYITVSQQPADRLLCFATVTMKARRLVESDTVISLHWWRHDTVISLHWWRHDTAISTWPTQQFSLGDSGSVCRRLAQRHWWERTATDTRAYCQKVKRKIDLYSAPSWEAQLCSAQVWITQLLHCKHTIPAFTS